MWHGNWSASKHNSIARNVGRHHSRPFSELKSRRRPEIDKWVRGKLDKTGERSPMYPITGMETCFYGPFWKVQNFNPHMTTGGPRPLSPLTLSPNLKFLTHRRRPYSKTLSQTEGSTLGSIDKMMKPSKKPLNPLLKDPTWRKLTLSLTRQNCVTNWPQIRRPR